MALFIGYVIQLACEEFIRFEELIQLCSPVYDIYISYLSGFVFNILLSLYLTRLLHEQADN